MNETSTGPAAVRAIRTIWMAILGSLLIYAMVLYLAVGERSTEPLAAHFANTTVLVLHLAGFATFVMGMVMSSRLLRGSMNAEARPGSPPLPTSEVVVTARTRVALIIRWALMESAAIFGLLAAFLMREPLLFLPLGALGAIGILASYPSDDRLRDMAAQSA
jgi:hypothetical protein